MRARVPLTLAAFGERKTLIEWTQDPRCQVSMRELRTRIEKGWKTEDALSTPTAFRPSRARNIVSAFGEEKSIADWANDPRAAVSGLTISARVMRGWDPEEAIKTPVHGKVRPPRETISRPPTSRRTRMLMSEEDISVLDASGVRERLEEGAELWLAGSSGDRVSIVHQDDTILISIDVLREMEAGGLIVPVCRVGSLVQYGLSPKAPPAVAKHAEEDEAESAPQSEARNTIPA